MLLHESRRIRTVLPRRRTDAGHDPAPAAFRRARLRRLGAALMRLLRRAEKRVIEHFRVPPNGAEGRIASFPAPPVGFAPDQAPAKSGAAARNQHHMW